MYVVPIKLSHLCNVLYYTVSTLYVYLQQLVTKDCTETVVENIAVEGHMYMYMYILYAINRHMYIHNTSIYQALPQH